MKAVIMAGGKGTRLRPLTCRLPKPMVPLLDRPCMEYIIELLKRHGITEIAVTVQFLPQVIKSYFGDGSEFGVKLHYFEETKPLGTAGSVKNADAFLDESFLVISGDALTDFDLTEAIRFHREKAALGTLVLTKVEVPLEYGVVMTKETGEIIRFLEKPSWSEVFSDTVNTGIYVLEPEILGFFKKGEEYDFSKNLFPLVMEKDLPLYGYVADGYWSDIGNLTQYRQTQFDMLNGHVNVHINGEYRHPNIWIEEGAKIHPDANLQGPAFIGKGTVIDAGARIGAYSVVGRYNRIEQSASLERTVVWNRCYIGKGATLTGATFCNEVRAKPGSLAAEDVVVGEKTTIGDMAVIRSGVKVWPGKVIGSGVVRQSSLIWENTASGTLFGNEGISGVPNVELTPELVSKIASAYGACLRSGSTISASSDESPYAAILKYAVISGLLAAGIKVRDVGQVLLPVARFDCRRTGIDGGIHISRIFVNGEHKLLLQFFDRDGLPIDKSMERKIHNAFLQEDFVRPDVKGLGLLEQAPQVLNVYIQELLQRVEMDRIRSRHFRVVLHCECNHIATAILPIFERLNCHVITLWNSAEMLENIVRANHADFGIQFDKGAQALRLVTGSGRVLTEDEVLLLQTIVALSDEDSVAMPVTAPSVLEDLANQAGRVAVHTKAAPRALLEVNKMNHLQVYSDGIFTIVSLLDYLAQTGLAVEEITSKLPEFFISRDMVTCPVEAKGMVMRRLMEEMKGQKLELIDGIKVLMDDGWALILPDAEKGLFKVVSEGSSRAKADELTGLYKEKIASYYEG
jgi:mannose-1-phosphate guanylyltransferase / phosphomannomutase